MKEITLVDQVMDNLAFEVEEVPQDGQISSASSNSPLNVKIRIRKKNRKDLPDGGIISIPKIDQTLHDSEKVRVTSSDQTIMSFNVLMDRGQFVKKRPPKQKRILQLFKRGGCLGVQNDEDQYEYSISTPRHTDKENDLPETMENLSDDSLDKANFTLAKNYSKQKHTDFLGKCKPGGCLDPPFGEDKYSYLPKLIDVAGTDETEIKPKIKECECKENLSTNNKVKSKDDDKIDYSSIVEREKTVLKYDSQISISQLKSSNSIITFPSVLLSTEALDKIQIQKRSKSYSGSRESKSYNLSNHLLETYYISPKIKTIDQEPKTATESKSYLDSTNSDILKRKDQKIIFDDTKPEAKADVESTKNFENGEKIALLLTKAELITNDIMNNVTQVDKAVLLKDQETGKETTRIPLMKKDETTYINVMPETSPLNIDDTKISSDKEKFENDKKYLDKLDSVQGANLQGIPKKFVESSLICENAPETMIVVSPNLTVDDIEEIKEAIEVPLDKIDQETIEIVTKSVESEEFKKKSDIETISLPQGYLTNKENLNALDVSSKILPEETLQIIDKTVIKSAESIVAKSSIETTITQTQDISYVKEDVSIKDYDSRISSSPEQQNKDTSNLDTLSVSKTIHSESIKDEISIDQNFVPQKISSFSNEDFIKKPTDITSLKDNMSVEATENAKNGMNGPLEDVLHEREDSITTETTANINFKEEDRRIDSMPKSPEDKLRELVNEYGNTVEEPVQSSVNTEISTEKISFEELKSVTAVPASPKYSEKNKIESDSNLITKLSIQSGKEEKDAIKVDSFHTNKSDTINSDVLAEQVYQDTTNITSVTHPEKVSEIHTDIKSLDSDIINKENLKLAQNTELQEVEDQKKSKSGILQDEIYHKDLEVTFSDKIRTESIRTSENILSKPTYDTEIPVDTELDQSRDKTWDSKENLNKKGTILGDNVFVSNEEHKDFNEPILKNYGDKGVIHLNMAFQSFVTDQDGSVIRTLNFSSLSDSTRYPNDNILQFTTIIRPNDGEIKIPIDSDKDLVLQIKTDDRYKGDGGSIKKFPSFDKAKSLYESNLLNKDNDRGLLLPGNTSTTKDYTSTGENNKEIDLQQTLDDVYKDKLLPLHDIIKKLKNDIDVLTKQQTMIKEKLYNTKRVQSNPVYSSGKKCGCIEMLFSR